MVWAQPLTEHGFITKGGALTMKSYDKTQVPSNPENDWP